MTSRGDGRREPGIAPGHGAILRSLALLLPGLSGCGSTEGPAAAPFPLPAIPWSPLGYVCHRAAEPPAIDGRLDDPCWLAAPATDPFVDIEGPLRPAPRLETRAKMLWDDRFLYVGADMEEPDVSGFLRARDSVIFHDNDFEVFLDPDGDARDYLEIEINALGTVWDLRLPRAYRDGGTAENGWDARGLRSAIDVRGTVNDPSDRDRGWSVEMAIPWDDLAPHAGRPAPPSPGDRWRINFSRVQWRYDTSGGAYEKVRDPATGRQVPEDNWVWSPQGIVAMHHPEMWGFLQFSGLAAGEGSEPLRPPDERERAPFDTLLRRGRAADPAADR